METREIFERRDIIAHDRLLGYASVRYPVTKNKHIDKYYQKLADAFIKHAEKNKLCGALACRVYYEDEEYISVITESRLYKENNCIRRHKTGFVWDRKKGTLCYIRKTGIRRCNITFNGRELSIFN